MRWAKREMGRPRFPLCSSSIPALAPEELGLQPGDLELSRASSDGDPRLRGMLAEIYGVSPDEVLVSHGATLAFFLFAAALLSPGDRVLFESPGYRPLADAVTALGAELVFVERPAAEGFAIDPERFRRAMDRRTRLIVLTDLHNPSGRKLDRERLEELVRVAAGGGAHLIVDEVYLEALPAGEARGARMLGGNVITVNSMSKVYGLPGLRIGWGLAPRELVRRALEINDYLAIEPSSLSEAAARRALERREWILARTRAIAAQGWGIVSRWLAGRPELECVAPAGGIICFPRLGSGIEVNELVRRASREEETLVVPGAFFGAPGHFRLGFGVPPEVLRPGLERLGRVLDALAGSSRGRGGPAS
jgi:hypothetical protein